MATLPIGERCTEFIRYHDCPNMTVNLLAGLNGVEYVNTVHGASDTLAFLQFFGKAGNAAYITSGRPALEVVVMDNCPTHHYPGGETLQEWLGERNVELVLPLHIHLILILWSSFSTKCAPLCLMNCGGHQSKHCTCCI